MNNNTLQYVGKVKLDIMKKGRRINTAIHNTGLPDMSWLFAKAVTGNLNQSTDIPRVLDIGYIIPNTNIWTSILNKPVNIGGRQYSYNTSEANWISTLISTVYYSDLNGGILDDVIERADAGTISLKMRLCSYQAANRKYFAEVSIDSGDITHLKELTSMIITWYSEIIPVESDNVTDAGNIVVDDDTSTSNDDSAVEL